MRFITTLALLTFTAACAGGEDVDAGDQTTDGSFPAAETGPVGDNPGLPTEEAEFQATSWGGAGDVGGRLWVSTATSVEEDGVSLVAQVENLPQGSYSWALHRGECTARDDLLMGLGYGAVADQRGRGEDVANGGGPLGEMPRVFRPFEDGSAEQTVFVPLEEGLAAGELQSSPHSVRIHPNVDGEDPGASIACAPIPAVPGA